MLSPQDRCRSWWNDYGICIGIMIILLFIVGCGISLAVIKTDSQHVTSRNIACPTFPPLKENDTFTLEKEIWKQWHWQYTIHGFSGYSVQRCPSLNHDSDLYVDGQLMARTNQKLLSLISETEFYDCHGDIIYHTNTGTIFQAIINGNKMDVSVQLFDANKHTIGYVEGKYFINNYIDISDEWQQKVARISREIEDWFLTWRFTIYNTTSPAADLRVLMLLATYRSFSEGSFNGKDKTDGCNTWFIAWIDIYITCACFVGVFLVFCFRDYFVGCWRNTRTWCANNGCTCCE